jgi:apolipoprotein N-acyltransferase
MDLESRLKVIEEKIDQNHKLLIKVRNTQKLTHYMRIGYWVFIILLGLGAFYFLQPIIAQIGNIYNFGSNELELIEELKTLL